MAGYIICIVNVIYICEMR